MKSYIDKLYVRISIAVIVGLLLAAAFTSFQQLCTTVIAGEEASQCVEFPKAIMYPEKLMSDQGLRTKFVTTFAVGSLVSFALVTLARIPRSRK